MMLLYGIIKAAVCKFLCCFAKWKKACGCQCIVHTGMFYCLLDQFDLSAEEMSFIIDTSKDEGN